MDHRLREERRTKSEIGLLHYRQGLEELENDRISLALELCSCWPSFG